MPKPDHANSPGASKEMISQATARCPQDTAKSGETTPLVLIVEDHEDTRFLLSYVLEQSGIRVVEARDGAEAVFVAQRLLPNLIVMDAVMPRVDGLTALKAIRKNELLREVPITLISGRAEREARVEAFSLGANEYFVKPFSLRDFEISVFNQLGIKRKPIF